MEHIVLLHELLWLIQGDKVKLFIKLYSWTAKGRYLFIECQQKLYRKTSSMRPTKYQKLIFFLVLSLPNPLKPSVKSRMKM